jgi:oligopeptidase B
MKNVYLFIVVVVTSLTQQACDTARMKREAYKWPAGIETPKATQKPRTFVQHGDTIVDEYYWLNDYFKKGPDSNAVVEYLNEENAYVDTMMAGTRDLQTQLIKEMRGRIQEKDESVPYQNNGYTYFTKTDEGKEYYKFYRKPLSGGADELLLDVDIMAEGKGYYSVSGLAVSPTTNGWPMEWTRSLEGSTRSTSKTCVRVNY